MSAADATPTFIAPHAKKGKRPSGERRSGYGILNPFDHKFEPVIDRKIESGNIRAAVAWLWVGYPHRERPSPKETV
jgi:hypothetical protein